MSFKFNVKPVADLSIAPVAGGGAERYLDLRDAIHALPVGQSLEVPVDYWLQYPGINKPDLTDSQKLGQWRSARKGTINKFVETAPKVDASNTPRSYRVVLVEGDGTTLAVIAEKATPIEKPSEEPSE